MPQKNRICFASIDVERDKGKEGFEGAESLDKILDIFEKYNISATLFVTGEVLEKYRDSAKNWQENYEVACHSYTHRFWDTLSGKEREKELDDFIELYQSVFQKRPLGFRAPSHIIDGAGLKLLGERGFLYDSSVLPHYPPFKKYRGYQGKKPKDIRFMGGFLEIPVAGQLLGIPLAGAWIQGLPLWVYNILFSVYSPAFITLNMHSWDVLKPQYLRKLEKVIKILKRKNYQFLNGEQIHEHMVSPDPLFGTSRSAPCDCKTIK